MDINVVLIFILALLTITLMVLGFYAILVLKEFRETVKKANHTLDNVNNITDMVSNPITSLVGLVGGIFQGIKQVKSITSLHSNDTKEE